MSNKISQEKQYFALRGVAIEEEDLHAQTPSYIKENLPENKAARILDVGCGYGGFLLQLQREGYTNIEGVDINEEATEHCKNKGLRVFKIDTISDFGQRNHTSKYDFIIMTHVIEHIHKQDIIPTLISIKSLLTPGGKLYLTTPNAQSRSGAYWTYEDFTHEWIFTSGSLKYVLAAAGFSKVIFIDKDGTSNSRYKQLKKILLWLYKRSHLFWNKITGAAYHPESPNIYTWELKVLAQ
jgi:2-polyprenyl-3-methyl-5-hydroxy-6-metoxy-1,4-benzoquinol methylase